MPNFVRFFAGMLDGFIQLHPGHPASDTKINNWVKYQLAFSNDIKLRLDAQARAMFPEEFDRFGKLIKN